MLKGEIRVGMVTDIHHGPMRPTRDGSQALGLLDTFITEMNRCFRPHLVFDLGDRIHDCDLHTDQKHMLALKRAFNGLDARVTHLVGNHDVKTTPKRNVIELFGGDGAQSAFEYFGVNFISLDTQDPPVGGFGGAVSELQRSWVRDTIRATQGPIIVLSHHPLDEQDVSTNPNFQHHPEWAKAEGRGAVRQILEDCGRVLAVFNGHVHWFGREVINGISYYSVPSLIEAWRPGEPPQGGFAEITIGPGPSVRVTSRGSITNGSGRIRRRSRTARHAATTATGGNT